MFRRVENLRMWTRNTLHGWFLRSPRGFEKRRREGTTTVRKKKETLALRSRGLNSPATTIGSTDGASVLPAVPRNYDREVISVYRPWVGSTEGVPVVPTRRRFYRGMPESPTENSYRYYRPCVGCTGSLNSFWNRLKV
jgi:hypothetical protein